MRYAGWDEAVLKKALNTGKNKYGAKRVQVDGIWFDSKREAARYGELKIMIMANLIKEDSLEIHPSFPIPPRETGDYDELPDICTVELDFLYWDEKKAEMIYQDVKGKDNPLSALKRKLVEAFYSIKVEIIK